MRGKLIRHEYKIVAGSLLYTSTFEKEVARLLADGWSLNGGVAVVHDDDATRLIQSVYRAVEIKRLPTIAEVKERREAQE